MAKQLDRFARQRAFTLVEVLVVIGVIALLISLMLPALTKARKQSYEIQCAANLRNWGQAFHMYADQYRGFLPHSADESSNTYPNEYAYSRLTPQNACCWDDLLPQFLGRPSWSSFANYKKPTGDIWQCPIAQVYSDFLYEYQPSIHGYHTYCMNAYLDAPPYAPNGPYAPFLNLAKCRATSTTLLMIETTLLPKETFGQNSISSDCFCGAYADTTPADLGDRHPHVKGKLGGNLMMLDGHIEWTDHLWDLSLPSPDSPPVTNRLWWPY